MNNPNNPIAVARLQAGLTQEQLASAIGVDSRQISEWECERRALSATFAMRIAAALKIDLAQLICVQTNKHYSPIRAARQKNRLTQTQLAKAVNVSQAQISNYENGVSTPPKETLRRIADILGVEPDALADSRKGTN